MRKINNINTLAFAALFAVPFTAQADVLVTGGHNWNLNFPGSTASYVVADTLYNSYGTAIDETRSTSGTANDSKSLSVEDSPGRTITSSGGPGGGQAYDAEKMFLEINGDTLHVAIVTGLSPNNSSWKAGDIFFDLNNDINSTDFVALNGNDTYAANSHAVVAASTAGNGNGYEYGLVVVDHGSNDPFVDGNSWDDGGLYNVSQWNLGDVASHEDNLDPVSGNAGDLQTDAATTLDYVDGIGEYAGKYIIEVAISLVDLNGVRNAFGQSLLDSASNGETGTINAHWAPLCNNDWIQYTGTLSVYNTPPNNSVPEPTPLALMAIGLIGMIARKKNNKV